MPGENVATSAAIPAERSRAAPPADPGHEPIDAVYTWVDGATPGYDELLRTWARRPLDLNPNRYRDNLDLLRFSLRSLTAFVPWVRRVHIVTARPQRPTWLRGDAPGLRIVHHDAFIPAPNLPTFNSFAIVANVHRLPGVSRRFLYVEDDRLFGRPVARDDLMDEEGRVRVWAKWQRTPDARRRVSHPSPWSAAQAQANGLLDTAYGRQRRGEIKHAPLLVDVPAWEAMVARWPDDFARTSASRFRSPGNLAPEHLFPYYMLHEGRGVLVPKARVYRDSSYHGLENWRLPAALALTRLRLLRPKFYPLNDNFGEHPNPRVVAYVRRWLERAYPVKSPFEI
jgi:hypothetical protein